MEPRPNYFKADMMNKIVKKCKALKKRQDIIEFMESWTAKSTICSEQEKVCEGFLKLAYKVTGLVCDSEIIALIENGKHALTLEE